MSEAETGGSLPKASAVTTTGSRQAAAVLNRVDAWRIARDLLTEDANPSWDEGPSPFDVIQLAKFLLGQKGT